MFVKQPASLCLPVDQLLSAARIDTYVDTATRPSLSLTHPLGRSTLHTTSVCTPRLDSFSVTFSLILVSFFSRPMQDSHIVPLIFNTTSPGPEYAVVLILSFPPDVDQTDQYSRSLSWSFRGAGYSQARGTSGGPRVFPDRLETPTPVFRGSGYGRSISCKSLRLK